MYFEFERNGAPIPEKEIEEVVRLTIDLIQKGEYDEEVYNDENFVEDMIDVIVTNYMEGYEIYYYYDLIQSHFLKEVRKRIAERLKKRGK